jgi:ribosomal protein S18 acetylase RimI-like enzyme
MIEILPMRAQHAGQVARLHMENLQTHFRGRAGRELLSLYYATMADELGGCGYIALFDNQVTGYVCGIWDASDLKRHLLRRFGARVLFWGIVQLVTYPSLLKDILLRVRTGGISAVPIELGYELRPIVVSTIKRGTGLANLLTTRLLEDASERGFSVVHLYTEEENSIARRFYLRVGFSEIGLVERLGRHYIRFEYRMAKI